MMVGFEGDVVPAELHDYLKGGAPCGVVLFRRNLTSTMGSVALLRALRALFFAFLFLRSRARALRALARSLPFMRFARFASCTS